MRARSPNSNQPMAMIKETHSRSDMPQKCLECGKEFFPWTHSKGSYCSRKCAGKSVGENGESRKKEGKTTYTCAWCAVTFLSYHKKRKFCSIACSNAANIGFKKSRTGAKDANHNELKQEFINNGISVIDLYRLGEGMPDLLVGYKHICICVEIKNPKSKYGRKGLNPTQQRWANGWDGPFEVVTSKEDVRRVISGMKERSARIEERLRFPASAN